MEGKAPNTISASLPVARFVGIAILHRILSWVPRIQILYSGVPSLLQLKHSFGFLAEMKTHCPELPSKQRRQLICLNEAGDDGKLSRKDIEAVMEKLGVFCNPNDETLQERLGCEEFSVLFENEEPSLEEVKEAFDVFDLNKDGFIDTMELQRVLQCLGYSLGIFKMEECKRMVETFDRNGDGRIDFNEFLKLTENSFQLTQRHE